MSRTNDFHKAEQVQMAEAHQLEIEKLKAVHSNHDRHAELNFCGMIIIDLARVNRT